MNIRRVPLIINGAERFVFCDPEKDTLAIVLRRIGLTGTKIGCNIGICGACSIIYNGKLIRCCTKKMKNVEDNAEITTIEGIGTPNHLHPLQKAWIRYGGVQCGFCSPGFIVSSYVLLQENPSPTRAEVREWFKKNNNVCRCTGYKPLVDCVMAAAAVMRGEASPDTLEYQLPEDGEYYGTPVLRPAALGKVCGVCDYGDDIGLKMPPGTLHLALVMPKAAHHAKIKNIDVTEAEQMPGVVKVVTAKDIEGTNLMGVRVQHPRAKVDKPTWPVFCDDKIYRYGDVVGCVAADTRDHARAAAAKVKVDLEPLPEYTNYLDAATPDAIEIHPGYPNVYIEQPLFRGEEDTRDVIDAAPYKVEGRFYSSREPHLMLEPDTVQSFYDEDGMLTIACKAQGVYKQHSYITGALGLAPEDLRLIENPTGASFGAAVSPHSYAVAGACAMALKVPVTLTMTWEENQHFSGKRAPSFCNARLAADKDGKICALEADFGCDHGAYHDMADSITNRFVRFIAFPFPIQNARGLFRTAYTNHNFATTYRGFGAPQVATTIASLADMLAEEVGMDPFDFLEKNVAKPGDLTVNGFPFREYPYPEIMKKGRPIYEEMCKTAAAESTPEKRRAVGVCVGGFSCTGGAADFAKVRLELNPDNTVTHFGTYEDQGQGGDAACILHTCHYLKPLGITPDKVRVYSSDTKYCPNTGMASSSRLHLMTGAATHLAAEEMLKDMKKADGTYRTYDELVAEGLPTKWNGNYEIPAADLNLVNLDPNTGEIDMSLTYMYNLFMADVEVEMATGKATCKRYVIVDDIGVIGNPISVEGQAYSGMSHMIGFALSEDYEDVKKHINIKASGIPYATDTPDDLRLYHCVTPRTCLDHGSAGCSEGYQSAGHVAVLNAIYRACGVRIYELPATPAKIKAGLDILAKGGKIEPPAPYFLGSDLYDELEEIKNNPV
jgi:aldehyde oxidoreductase